MMASINASYHIKVQKQCLLGKGSFCSAQFHSRVLLLSDTRSMSSRMAELIYSVKDVIPVKGRQLGPTEMLNVMFQSRAGFGVYYHVCLLESTTMVTNEQFLESFRTMVNFQPLMRMKIKHHDLADTRTHFEHIPADFCLPIKFQTLPENEDWTGVIEKEKSANIVPQIGPLWRAIIAKKAHSKISTEKDPNRQNSSDSSSHEYLVIFFFHHTVADGVSCFDLICNQFLQILNKIINDEPPSKKFENPLPMTPTLEVAFLGQNPTDFALSWYMKAILRLLRWKHHLFAASDESKRPLLYSRESPKSAESACFTKYQIPADLTTGIIEASRCHGVTVHSVLLTALSYSTTESMNAFGFLPDRIIKHTWPINLRKMIPELSSPQPLGYFLSEGSSEIKLPEDFKFHSDQAWLCAKNVSNSIKDTLNRDKLTFGVNFVKYLLHEMNCTEGNPFRVFEELGFKMHFSLSNLGNCDKNVQLEDTSSNFVDLKGTYFGNAVNDFSKLVDKDGGISFIGPFITVHTFKGCMNIAVSYSDKWISRGFMEQFLRNTEYFLTQMCRASKEN